MNTQSTAEGVLELREVRLEDLASVADFLSSHFAPFPPAVWSERLRHILWENPNISVDYTAGWVLVRNYDEIVGFLGNVVHPFQVGEYQVRAAATTAWCVAPEHRSSGLLLADAFFEQDNVDLLFNTTANETAGKLFSLMGANPVPAASFDDVFFWIVKPGQFLRDAVEYVTKSPRLGLAASTIGSLPLAIIETLRKHRMKISSETAVTPLHEFGSEWTDSWESWRTGLITGVRSHEQMAWRLGSPDQHAFAVRDSAGRPLGYGACRVCAAEGNSFRRLRFTDIWIDPQFTGVIHSIINHAMNLAAELDCVCLEVCGLGKGYRELLQSLNPHRRRKSACPYYFHAREPGLAEYLGQGERWHPSEYDGDSPFSLTFDSSAS